MAYRDILVYLDPTVETVERVRLAVALARAHGARRLTGVDISAARGPGERDRSRGQPDLRRRDTRLRPHRHPRAGGDGQFHPLPPI